MVKLIESTFSSVVNFCFNTALKSNMVGASTENQTNLINTSSTAQSTTPIINTTETPGSTSQEQNGIVPNTTPQLTPLQAAPHQMAQFQTPQIIDPNPEGSSSDSNGSNPTNDSNYAAGSDSAGSSTVSQVIKVLIYSGTYVSVIASMG